VGLHSTKAEIPRGLPSAFNRHRAQAGLFGVQEVARGQRAWIGLRPCGRALNEKNSSVRLSRIFAARLVVATALAVMALSALFAALRILE
jgi:hypothetical protein